MFAVDKKPVREALVSTACGELFGSLRVNEVGGLLSYRKVRKLPPSNPS